MTGGPQVRIIRTRERILAAAVDLFLENGFHGTNIDSIAARSRSSKQTIYKYFDDKNEILDHSIERLRDEFAEYSPIINLDSPNISAELSRFGLYYLENILKERQVKTFRLCVEMARKNSKLAASFSKMESENIQTVLVKYIQHLFSKGLILLHEDPEFMAEAFLGLVRGNFQFFRAVDEDFLPTQQELHNHVERATQLFCGALEFPAEQLG